jgi:hypothetical protein
MLDGSEPSMLASGVDPTPAPTDPEVKHIEDDLDTGPDLVPDWRIPYLDCFIRGILLADKTEARCLARRAKSFVLLDRELYKRCPTRILQHLHPQRAGEEATTGHPWGHLRSPCRATHPCWKRVLTGFLLAHCYG